MAVTTVNAFDTFIDAVASDLDVYKIPYSEMYLANSDTVKRPNGDIVRTAEYLYPAGGGGPNHVMGINVQQVVDSPRKESPMIRCSLEVYAGFAQTSDLTDETQRELVSAVIAFRYPADSTKINPSTTQLNKMLLLAIGAMFNSYTTGTPSESFVSALRVGIVTSLLSQTQT